MSAWTRRRATRAQREMKEAYAAGYRDSTTDAKSGRSEATSDVYIEWIREALDIDLLPWQITVLKSARGHGKNAAAEKVNEAIDAEKRTVESVRDFARDVAEVYGVTLREDSHLFASMFDLDPGIPIDEFVTHLRELAADKRVRRDRKAEKARLREFEAVITKEQAA